MLNDALSDYADYSDETDNHSLVFDYDWFYDYPWLYDDDDTTDADWYPSTEDGEVWDKLY